MATSAVTKRATPLRREPFRQQQANTAGERRPRRHDKGKDRRVQSHRFHGSSGGYLCMMGTHHPISLNSRALGEFS